MQQNPKSKKQKDPTNLKERVIRFFTVNLSLKFIALIMSLGLFLYVRMGTIDVKIVTLPLEIIGQSSALAIASELPATITIHLSGPKSDLDDLVQEDYFAKLLVPQNTPGTLNCIPTLSKALPSTISITKMIPSSINVKTEKRGSKMIRVTPQFSGALSPGYSLNETSVTPSEILVHGPISMLENLTSFKTESIYLASVKEDTTFETTIATTITPLLKFNREQTFTVSLEVFSVFVEKSFRNIPYHFLNFPKKYSIKKNISVPNGFISMHFNPMDIESYSETNDLFLLVDASSISKEGVVKLEVTPSPTTFSKVIDYFPKEITIEIDTKERASMHSIKSNSLFKFFYE